jgi:hypothetical protein
MSARHATIRRGLWAAPLLSVLALLGAPSASASGETLVHEFRGLGATDTAPFSVSTPWVIEWWSRPPTAIDQDPAHLEVYLYDAITNEFLGRLMRHKGVGRGDVLIERGGRFRFRVQGQATHWELRILQVDEERAEALRATQRRPQRQPRFRLDW